MTTKQKNVIRKWIKALRSKKYKQGYGTLRRDGKFCCLGVLCDLHAQETGGEWRDDWYHGSLTQLPSIVDKWAGFDSLNKKVLKRHNNLPDELIGYNDDDGWSFKKIANFLERELL